MKRFLLSIVLTLLSAIALQARETVQGIVVDTKGNPVPGVKVEVPGTSDFVFTDLDGAFQIVLRDPVKKLNFTYPGVGTSSHRVAPEMKVMLGKGWAGREKGYRNMIDLEGGIGIKGNASFRSGDNRILDIHTFVLPGLTFTCGGQINRHLFLGVGTGAYLDLVQHTEEEKYYSDDYSTWKETELMGTLVPLFLAARWDFGLSKKTAPYVGLRVGYSAFISHGGGVGYASSWSGSDTFSSSIEVTQKSCASLYIAPSIGYRMTVYNKFGINLGLTYLMGRRSKYEVYRHYSDHYSEYQGNSTVQEFNQRTSDALLFNIGFDF